MDPSPLRLKLWSKTFKRLPSFKGKTRLANLILGRDRDICDITVKAFDDSYYLVPSLREELGFNLFAVGFYEMEEIGLILKRLRSEDGFFLDIGANIGIYTVTAARALGEKAKIVAVEASPRICNYLKHNIKLNKSQGVKLLQCAVTDKDNSRVCFQEAPLSNFAMSSISPRYKNGNAVFVDTKTVDAIVEEEGIKKVSVIKIDVEGHEAAVLKGASKLLAGESPPLVLFEFCDWAEINAKETNVGDSQRILRELGYNIWRSEDYIKGKKPLSAILKKGALNMVAVKNGN